MRTRSEIELSAGNEFGEDTDLIIIEVLLDIRDQNAAKEKKMDKLIAILERSEEEWKKLTLNGK